MASLNKVMLIGTIGKDPEIKRAQSGLAIARFTLVTNKSTKKGDEWEQIASWHNITCFGKTAEYVEKNCKKGSQIYLEGEIQYNSWESDDGTKKYKTDIIAEKITGLDRKTKSDDSESNDSAPTGDAETDLPF